MQLSQAELTNSRLNPDTLASAIQQVRVNGFVLFERVLPDSLLDELRREFMPIYERFIHDPGQTFGVNHYRIYLPFRPPFNNARIILNPIVIPVMEGLLGANMLCRYFASNTCAPGSEYQPVHSDFAPLFPESDIKPPANFVVLNISLADVTEENGPMAYWSGGTHYLNMPREAIAEAARDIQPQYATMPAGSIFIRDGRMWHQGTPNRSNAPRPMLALVYTRNWLSLGRKRISIPQDIYDSLPERGKQLFALEDIGGELERV